MNVGIIPCDNGLGHISRSIELANILIKKFKVTLYLSKELKNFSINKKISIKKINTNFMENSEQIINKIIKNCICIKVKVVEEDFKETDKRSILNFGHTVGHGLEKLYSYKKSHGDCIGLGMAIEASIANKYFSLSDNNLNKIYTILNRFSLRCIKYSSAQIKTIIKHMELDKKNKTNKITFSLPDKIGSIMVNNKKHTIEVSKEKINSVLKEFS